MLCENCKAYNCKEIILYEGEEVQHLCPRCLKILYSMIREYENTIAEDLAEKPNKSYSILSDFARDSHS